MSVAEDRRRAGLFLLASVALLLAFLGILAGVRFLQREETYVVEFRESVAGLEISSPVKYNGVPVGKVTAIHFHPEDLETIQVEIAVKPEVAIKRDTRAQLKPQGITGIFYLELYGGSRNAPLLEKGAPITLSDPSLTTKIGGIATDLSDLIRTLNEFVKKNEANLSYAIADFRASAGSIKDTLGKVDRVVEGAGGAVEEAKAGLADLRTEVKAAGDGIRKALDRIEELLRDPALRGLASKASGTLDLVNEKVAAVDTAGISDKIKAILDRFDQVEASIDRAAAAVAALAEQGQTDVAALLADVRAAAANVKALTRALREDPSRVLGGKTPVDKAVPDPMAQPKEDK